MRISFKEGEQQKFMEKILCKISVAKSARICGLSERTIRDWRRGKFLMHEDAMIKLCKEANVSVPKDFEEKDDYWYAVKGAKLGGFMGSAACIKKYGCIGGPNRISGWKKWWNEKGKFNDSFLFRRKPINKPSKSSELAEFIGIMLGDGGISAKGKQIHITLNYKDDAEYIKYVCSLIEKLFKRKPGICERKSDGVFVIFVSSMDLIDYLVELGLRKGNKIKLQVDIPNWIKNNRSYSIACVRGLVDTDGCVFNHKYKVNNKFYNYTKLSFTSYSQPMRKSVYNILKSLGIKSRLFSYRDVRIDSQKDVKKYFDLVGSSNPKHLNKYYK